MQNKLKMLTIKEAALLIDGLTEYRIRQMCISGQLQSFKAGRKYLISEKHLEPVHIKIASKIIAKVRFPKYRTSSLS